MSGPDGLANQVRLPLLATELPEGWHVSESATITAPSGQTFRATLDAADDDLDPITLIDAHIAEFRRERGEPAEVRSSADIWRGGVELHHCTIRFGDDAAHLYALACVVDNGLALSLATDWPADVGDGAIAMEAVLGGIRLLSRPAFEPDSHEDHTNRSTPAARPPVSAEVWSSLRAEWSRPSREVSEASATSSWSPDELATFATLLGAPSFPTVGTEFFASLPDAELRAVLGATMRSLAARGLVDLLSNGSAAIGGDVRSMVETAVSPDLAIAIQHGGSSSTYFGVRPDQAVRIDTVSSSSRRCCVHRPADVMDLIMEVVCSRDCLEIDSARQSTAQQMTADQLSQRWAAMVESWQISSTWRAETVIVGGLLYLARDSDGRLWTAEPEPHVTDQSSWIVRPVTPEEVRVEVLRCLPGVGSQPG